MLEKLVEEYSEPAYQFAYRLCGNAEEAKEMVQEAFFRVIKNWDSYDAGQSLKGYFFGILKNLYADSQRNFTARNVVSLSTPLASGEELTLGECLPDTATEPILDQLDRRERSQRVHRVLEGLKAEHRAILTLCDLQGLRYEEIAQVLDCPLGTVRSRINRARLEFKAHLIKFAGEEVNAYAV